MTNPGEALVKIGGHRIRSSIVAMVCEHSQGVTVCTTGPKAAVCVVHDSTVDEVCELLGLPI